MVHDPRGDRRLGSRPDWRHRTFPRSITTERVLRPGQIGHGPLEAPRSSPLPLRLSPARRLEVGEEDDLLLGDRRGFEHAVDALRSSRPGRSPWGSVIPSISLRTSAWLGEGSLMKICGGSAMRTTLTASPRLVSLTSCNASDLACSHRVVSPVAYAMLSEPSSTIDVMGPLPGVPAPADGTGHQLPRAGRAVLGRQ